MKNEEKCLIFPRRGTKGEGGGEETIEDWEKHNETGERDERE